MKHFIPKIHLKKAEILSYFLEFGVIFPCVFFSICKIHACTTYNYLTRQVPASKFETFRPIWAMRPKKLVPKNRLWTDPWTEKCQNILKCKGYLMAYVLDINSLFKGWVSNIILPPANSLLYLSLRNSIYTWGSQMR